MMNMLLMMKTEYKDTKQSKMQVDEVGFWWSLQTSSNDGTQLE